MVTSIITLVTKSHGPSSMGWRQKPNLSVRVLLGSSTINAETKEVEWLRRFADMQ